MIRRRQTDGATVSSNKDDLVNIGGFLALRDSELARKAPALLVAFEGLQTYRGMAGRDMDALAEVLLGLSLLHAHRTP